MAFVFKSGTAPHTNSFALGETGRCRTNVWDYAGISSLGDFDDAMLAFMERHGITDDGALPES